MLIAADLSGNLRHAFENQQFGEVDVQIETEWMPGSDRPLAFGRQTLTPVFRVDISYVRV